MTTHNRQNSRNNSRNNSFFDFRTRKKPIEKMIEGLPVDYKDIDVLLNYVSDRAKITSAYRIGNNAKDHRSLTTAIKRARFMALLPISHDHEIIRSPKKDSQVETPKEEPKTETPKEEPKAETSKEEPKVETPKEEPKAETSQEEPKVETPEEKNKEEDKK